MYEGFYDEPYFEPDEVELAAMEFKDKIMQSAKQQFKNRIEELEKQVKELQDEIERAKEEAKENAKRLKAKEYMHILSRPAFVINCERKTYLPKCDKCDDKRIIHFTSPTGKKMTEQCSCAKIKCFYTVEDAVVYQSEPENEYRYVGYVNVSCFIKTNSSEEEPHLEVCRYLWNGQKDMKYMVEHNYYELLHTHFFNREDCEMACKLLQEKADKECEDK